MPAGLLLQILAPCFAEAEMLPRVFLRLLVIGRIAETIRQIGQSPNYINGIENGDSYPSMTNCYCKY